MPVMLLVGNIEMSLVVVGVGVGARTARDRLYAAGRVAWREAVCPRRFHERHAAILTGAPRPNSISGLCGRPVHQHHRISITDRIVRYSMPGSLLNAVWPGPGSCVTSSMTSFVFRLFAVAEIETSICRHRPRNNFARKLQTGNENK